MSDEFSDRGGGRGRGHGSSRGGGVGGRGGGGGGGGFNKHRQSMNFQQHVPKFIAQMLQANPSARLQGMDRRGQVRPNGGGGRMDEMDQLMEMTAGSSTHPRTGTGRPEDESDEQGRERPDREDEAPQVANLDEYEGEDLSAILPQIKQKQSTNGEDVDASKTAASTTTSTAAVPPAPIALSLTDSRLLSVKRARESDPTADALEAQTGQHIFRKSIKATSSSTTATDEETAKANAGLTPEEIARKKKRKKEADEKKKSMLTFEEDDI